MSSGIQHIELLFDRETPEMQNRRLTRGEEVGIRLTGEDESPVRHVRQRRDDVAAEALALDGVGDEHAEQQGQDQARECRRHEPSEPSHPKRLEADPTVRGALGQQQRRDQEAGEGEEGRHAEIATDHPRKARVEQEHTEHGDAPYAVQGGEIGEVRCAGLLGRTEWSARFLGARRADFTSATATAPRIMVRSSWSFSAAGPTQRSSPPLGATSTFTIAPPRNRCTVLALTLLRRVAFGSVGPDPAPQRSPSASGSSDSRCGGGRHRSLTDPTGSAKPDLRQQVRAARPATAGKASSLGWLVGGVRSYRGRTVRSEGEPCTSGPTSS